MKNGWGLLFSLIFLVLTAGAFYWLWGLANELSSVSSTAGKNIEQYESVEIDSVKKQAADILAGTEKVSEIPLSAPTTDVGKANPFE